jgi:hypothetical protein
MKIPIWDFGQIPKGSKWKFQNRAKSTILGHFFEIFEIFIGGKGTPYHVSPTQQAKQICHSEFVSFLLSLGDNEFN